MDGEATEGLEEGRGERGEGEEEGRGEGRQGDEKRVGKVRGSCGDSEQEELKLRQLWSVW